VILKGFEKNRVDFLDQLNRPTDQAGQAAIQTKINANDANLRKFRDVQREINQKGRNAAGRIGRLLNFAREVALTNDASLERDLQEIKLDDDFFLSNKRLRRPIDFTYLYQ
jgi:hypothetical protein